MTEPEINKCEDLKANPSGIRVLWIRAHPAFAYSADQVGFVTPENAELLSKREIIHQSGLPDIVIEPFIEVLPENYSEPVIEKITVPESEYISVKFKKPHPKFSYREGATGKVTPQNYILLLEGGFVEPYQEEGKPGIGKHGLWRKFKNHFLK